MAAQTPIWFEQKYIRGVIMALQSEGFMTRGMAQMESNVKGSTVEWKVAGKGKATVMNPGVERRPTMNAGRSILTAAMTDYEANEWINMTDLEKMSENEQQIAQQTGAMAIGRTYDTILFQAMDADVTVPTIGDGTTDISVTNLLLGQAQIFAQGINGLPDMYVALPALIFAQLLLFKEFTNSDYVGDEYPLRKKMGAKTFLGMTIFPMPDEYFNASAAGVLDGYMWSKSSIGFCTNYDLRSRIDYVPTEKAYFAANTMGMCARTLLPTGIRRLRFKNDPVLVRNF